MPNEFVELNRRNIFVWSLMAFQAGAVNAGGFLACNRFVTHTTGFATHFAVELANHHEGVALGMLSVPVFFLAGSMTSSYFIDLRMAQGRSANYLTPCLLIFFCLLGAMLLGRMGIFGLFGDNMVFHQDYLLLVLLCLASGLQNALITNAQGVVVRTTHLTGITTDLGVGLVRSFFGEKRLNDTRLQQERLATFARAGIIFSFVLGSAVSSYLYLKAHYLGFVVPVVTSLILMSHFVRKTRKKEPVMRSLSTKYIGLFLLLAFSAHAAPEIQPPAAGNYGFQGAFSVALKLHYEVVYAFTSEEAAKLEKLRAQGYECWNKGRQTYLCKAFQSTEGAESVIRARVERELANRNSLILGERRGEPELISKGTDVAEYLVHQPATFAGKSYPEYRLVYTQGLWSIRFGEPTELQFNLENGSLKLPLEIPVTESSRAYSVYVGAADFLRM